MSLPAIWSVITRLKQVLILAQSHLRWVSTFTPSLILKTSINVNNGFRGICQQIIKGNVFRSFEYMNRLDSTAIIYGKGGAATVTVSICISSYWKFFILVWFDFFQTTCQWKWVELLHRKRAYVSGKIYMCVSVKEREISPPNTLDRAFTGTRGDTYSFTGRKTG